MGSEVESITGLQDALSVGLLHPIKELLDEQAKEGRQFNIFRVFGIEELEIRHSFMLKWLLSPMENHGLGRLFLKLFLKEVIDENDVKHPGRYDALRNVQADDYKTFVVDREVDNIDLLLISEEKKIVIAIENKWNASERVDTENKEGQLSEYEKLVSGRFPDHKWNRYFIFLTPDKRSPSKKNVDAWDVLGYDNIKLALEHILKDSRILSGESPEVQERRILIEHYYRIVERKLNMEGKEIEELCTQIYDQHRDALDLLFKRADRRNPILRHLEKIEFGNGVVLRAEKSEATSYVQYKRRLPAKKPNSVHYEISVDEKGCKVLLHIEKATDAKIRRGLLEAVLSECREVTDVAPIERKQKHSEDPNLLGGAEIRIPRRGRSDADVENDIRGALWRMYEVFESILQDFEKRKK